MMICLSYMSTPGRPKKPPLSSGCEDFAVPQERFLNILFLIFAKKYHHDRLIVTLVFKSSTEAELQKAI